MEETKKNEIINLREIIHILWKNRKSFYKVWAITFVLACAWIFPKPRTYQSSVMLAPEAGEQMGAGALGNLASTFGINLGGMNSGDAIYPQLYPDVFTSNDFIVSLFSVPVKNIDGTIETDYLTYLKDYQQHSIWDYPKIWIKKLINSIFPPEGLQTVGEAASVDPFKLTQKEEMIVKAVKNSIQCSVNKKTDVITINVVDQDPLICATMCDSACAHLQDFIIRYRTSKARIDMEYYSQMVDEMRMEYQRAASVYSEFCDTHRNSILQTHQTRKEELENDMQMKFNTYNVMSTQLDAARAKIQERTPAFTILQNASVPTKPSAPKRMIFVAAMLILASMIKALWMVRKDLHLNF